LKLSDPSLLARLILFALNLIKLLLGLETVRLLIGFELVQLSLIWSSCRCLCESLLSIVQP
jgi:hypothetical protein